MATSYATWRRQATLDGAVELGPDTAEVVVPVMASIDSPSELDYLLVQVEVRVPVTWDGYRPLPNIALVDDQTGEQMAVEWGSVEGTSMVGTFGPVLGCEDQEGLCELSATLIFTPQSEAPMHVDWTATAETSALGDDPGGAVLILE